MELLRKRLGMRPTDVRRVIKKAPEVLTPRADGSTAAEAVDVSIDSLIRVKKTAGVSIDRVKKKLSMSVFIRWSSKKKLSVSALIA